jgi:hypothetical protein
MSKTKRLLELFQESTEIGLTYSETVDYVLTKWNLKYNKKLDSKDIAKMYKDYIKINQ